VSTPTMCSSCAPGCGQKRMEACALLLSAYKDGSGLKAAKTLRVLVNNVITVRCHTCSSLCEPLHS